MQKTTVFPWFSCAICFRRPMLCPVELRAQTLRSILRQNPFEANSPRPTWNFHFLSQRKSPSGKNNSLTLFATTSGGVSAVQVGIEFLSGGYSDSIGPHT